MCKDSLNIELWDTETTNKFIEMNELNDVRKQGIEQKAIEIAKSMLKDNMPVETISKYTGLSLEEIKEL